MPQRQGGRAGGAGGQPVRDRRRAEDHRAVRAAGRRTVHAIRGRRLELCGSIGDDPVRAGGGGILEPADAADAGAGSGELDELSVQGGEAGGAAAVWAGDWI